MSEGIDTTHPPLLDGRPTVWLRDFMRRLYMLKYGRVRSKNDARLWRTKSCPHLDGRKLRAAQEKRKTPRGGRWYLDADDAETIIDSISSEISGTQSTRRATVSQRVAIREYGISRYLLGQLEEKNRLTRILTVGRGRSGGVLYLREELEREAGKIRGGSPESCQDESGEWWFTVSAAAERYGETASRIQTAIDREDLPCESRVIPGTLAGKKRMVRDADLRVWKKRERKNPFPSFDGVYDDPAGRRLNLQAAGLLHGSSRDRIRHAVRRKQLKTRFDIRPGTRLREQTVLEADVLTLIAAAPPWRPPAGFLNRRELIARSKLKWRSTERITFDRVLTETRQRLQEGVDYIKQPGSRAFYYQERILDLIRETCTASMTVPERNNLWLEWSESDGLGPAGIRDRWNKLRPEMSVGVGKPGSAVVKTALRRAKDARKGAAGK